MTMPSPPAGVNAFGDPATGALALWEFNHKEEQGGARIRQVTNRQPTIAPFRTVPAIRQQAVRDEIVYKLAGTVPTLAQHLMFLRFQEISLHRTIYFFHAAGEVFECVLSDYEPQRRFVKHGPRGENYVWDYTMQLDVVNILAARPAPIPPPPPGPPPPPPPPGVSPARFSRVIYARPSMTTASKYAAMDLQGNSAGQMAALRTAGFTGKGFVYQDGIWSNPNPVLGLATNPSWLALDQHGNPIKYLGSSTTQFLWQVDNPSFQAAWLTKAISEGTSQAYDGIFIDDVSALLPLTAGVSCPRYPTQAAWVTAVTNFCAAVGPGLRAAGLLACGNIGGATRGGVPSPAWTAFLTSLDWAMEESWMDGGLGLAQQASAFTVKLANAAWAEANGKGVFLRNANATRPGNVYGLAVMLLVAGGNLTYCTSNSSYGGYEAWYPEYDVANALGAPLGAYTVSGGVYTRQFANGTVTATPASQTGTIT